MPRGKTRRLRKKQRGGSRSRRTGQSRRSGTVEARGARSVVVARAPATATEDEIYKILVKAAKLYPAAFNRFVGSRALKESPTIQGIAMYIQQQRRGD